MNLILWEDALNLIMGVLMMFGLDLDNQTQMDVYCGAQNVYFESRGEPELGQIAVSQVVINRVKDSRWPDSVCAVVWESDQFSWTHDGKSDEPDLQNPIERKSWIKSVYSFIMAIKSQDVTNNATHYYAFKGPNKISKPYWSEGMEVTAIIGNHKFLK